MHSCAQDPMAAPDTTAGRLPIPVPAFRGEIQERATVSTPSHPEIQHPPAGAPGTEPLSTGGVELGVHFEYDGGGLGKGGQVHLTANGDEIAGGRLERTVPFLFSMSCETLDVGVDTGAPVGPYPQPFGFTGSIERIDIELFPALDAANRQEVHDGQVRGAMASQ
jgi:hypothetical protein